MSEITVEPMIFLTAAGLVLMFVASDAVWYQTICAQHFPYDFCVNHINHKGAPTNYSSPAATEMNINDVSDYLQSQTAKWKTFRVTAYFVPAIFVDTILAAWSDIHGRKLNMLWGLFGGILFSALPLCIMSTFPYIPLWVWLIFSFLAGSTGCLVIIFMAANAYIIDFCNKSSLSVRLTVLYTVISVANVLGELLCGYMLTRISMAYIMTVSSAILAAAFLYTIVAIKQIPPKNLQKFTAVSFQGELNIPEEVASSSTTCENLEKSSDGEIDKSDYSVPILKPILDVFQLLKDCMITFSKPRSGHSRGLLIAVCLTEMVIAVTEMGGQSVFSYYCFDAPLNWTPSQLSYFSSVTSIVGTVGTFVGVLIFKNCLNLRDTAVLVIATLSSAGALVMMSLAWNTETMYISSAISLVAGIGNPCRKSFVASLVEADEVGKAFTIFTVTQEISLLFSVFVFSSVYPVLRTVFFPGFLFLVSGSVIAICAVVFIAIYFVSLWDERTVAVHQL